MAQDLTQTRIAQEDISQQIEREVRTLWRTLLRGVIRGAELIVSAIPILCIAATVVAQLLYAGYNPWQDAISSLVWGRYGSIQTAAFYLLGFSIMVLAIKMFLKAKQRVLKTGIIALAITGLGMVMVGIFPAARSGFPQTIISAIHLNVSSALIFLFPIACFVMAPRLKECFSHRWLSAYTLISGILGVVFMMVEGFFHLTGRGWMGTFERLEILNGIAWVQTVTILTLINNRKKRPVTTIGLQKNHKEEKGSRRASTVLKTAALTAVCALVLFPVIQNLLELRQK